MSEYMQGITIKSNMMAGRPTRTKSGGNYSGLVIPSCGDYDTKEDKVPRPPWLTPVGKGKSISLDEEIRAFMRYMDPTPQEVRMRMDLVQRFTKLITSFNIDASVQPVGSYVTGLYFPTSDIDMVISKKASGSRPSLSILIGKIRDSGFASRVEDVLQASVPLIRITDKITGIQVDLTAADTHAVNATKAVQKWLQMVVAWVELEMPRKKPVASFDYDSFITAFGGLSMSKENVATSSSSSEGMDLGELLIKFLKFYGEEFSYETKAIEIAPVPSYNTFIDMGSKAYGIKHIQASFRSAYQSLANLEAKRKSGQWVGEAGILGSVLGGDYTKFVEKRRLAVARTPNM